MKMLRSKVTVAGLMLIFSIAALGGVAASDWQLTDATPLMSASQKGDIATVENLLAKDADVNETNDAGATPLIFASSKGQLPAIRRLLKAGANPNKCAWESMCPLWYAVNNGSYASAKLLIDAGAKASVNPGISALEHPPLHHAAANGRTDLVSLLLDHGAKVDFSDTFGGNTALAMAVRVGQAKTARQLLERGANLGWVTEVPYYDGKTALEIAKAEGHFETVSLVQIALKNKKYSQPKFSMNSVVDRLYKDPSYDLGAEGKELLEYLQRQSRQNLQLLRNTIYARKNYKFEEQKLIKYFSARFKTYQPSRIAVEMNAIDKRNLGFLKQLDDWAIARDSAG